MCLRLQIATAILMVVYEEIKHQISFNYTNWIALKVKWNVMGHGHLTDRLD